MKTDREVMQQALEALDSDNPDVQLRAAIVLREALERAKQMNIYPFAGEIKITKVVKDGKEVIEWEPVPLQSDCFNVDPVTGNVGIGTPSQEPIAYTFTPSSHEWARIDKDMNVTHLDMELCAKGPHNAYSALAVAIWNKAIETEREACAQLLDKQADLAGDPMDREWAQEMAAAIRARGDT